MIELHIDSALQCAANRSISEIVDSVDVFIRNSLTSPEIDERLEKHGGASMLDELNPVLIKMFGVSVKTMKTESVIKCVKRVIEIEVGDLLNRERRHGKMVKGKRVENIAVWTLDKDDKRMSLLELCYAKAHNEHDAYVSTHTDGRHTETVTRFQQEVARMEEAWTSRRPPFYWSAITGVLTPENASNIAWSPAKSKWTTEIEQQKQRQLKKHKEAVTRRANEIAKKTAKAAKELQAKSGTAELELQVEDIVLLLHGDDDEDREQAVEQGDDAREGKDKKEKKTAKPKRRPCMTCKQWSDIDTCLEIAADEDHAYSHTYVCKVCQERDACMITAAFASCGTVMPASVPGAMCSHCIMQSTEREKRRYEQEVIDDERIHRKQMQVRERARAREHAQTREQEQARAHTQARLQEPERRLNEQTRKRNREIQEHESNKKPHTTKTTHREDIAKTVAFFHGDTYIKDKHQQTRLDGWISRDAPNESAREHAQTREQEQARAHTQPRAREPARRPNEQARKRQESNKKPPRATRSDSNPRPRDHERDRERARRREEVDRDLKYRRETTSFNVDWGG